jgi:hypothetical protein
MECEVCGEKKQLQKYRPNLYNWGQTGLEKPKSTVINICFDCKTSIIESITGDLCLNSIKFVKLMREIL